MAGSDDGHFFVWEKKSSNIVKAFVGDSSIVNCLEPHPSCCLLATSGIDSVVRLWSPRPDVSQKIIIFNANELGGNLLYHLLLKY